MRAPRALSGHPVRLGYVPEQAAEPIHHVYYGFDRKSCKVQLDDGSWCFGEIRSWDRDEHGHWSAYIMWSTGPGQGNQLGRFPAERVRSG